MRLTKKYIFPTVILATALIFLVLFLKKALFVGAPKPQEPSFPLPYYAEDVTFQNIEDDISLAGTLTLPAKDGVYPAVILISGSGPQNRDEELMGHRPFLVLSDHLTRQGIAVLRYDDRGVGKSTGHFNMSALDDFASDVNSAIAYLRTRKEIDQKNIGLIGHSEGGVIAPMVAASSDAVSFIVLLAGPGIKSTELLPLQQKMIARSAGATEAEADYVQEASSDILEMLIKYDDKEVFRAKLTEFTNINWEKIKGVPNVPKDLTKEQYVSSITNAMTARWFKGIVRYDPAPVLEQVDCPVLALIGEKDVQVPSKENLSGINNALARGGNTDILVKELPDLNHLFQECETGGLDEYAKIKQTFSPVALNEISAWVHSKLRK